MLANRRKIFFWPERAHSDLALLFSLKRDEQILNNLSKLRLLSDNLWPVCFHLGLFGNL